MPISEAFNMDNMKYMAGIPDKWFDLAVVDPPYGETCSLSGGKAAKDGFSAHWGKITDDGNWNTAPGPEYFEELFRVSRNQIIWGANHYPNRLPPSSGWIFWDKGQRDFSFSDGELAFSSFGCRLRVVEISRASLQKEVRFHPTQKPATLYRWLFQNYAKPGDRILDTHLGSGSSRIAAYDMGLDFYATELDPDYFAAMEARFRAHIAKPQLFTPEQQCTFRQTTLEL